jgi:hypothetical protein
MIGFTLCSNNYLALARSLVASWAKHHPEDLFVLGLVDRRDPAIDYTLPGRAEVIEVASIGIPDFDELTSKYDITELNTAVKPYYFDFLLKHRGAEKIIYLDPDILVFRPFRMVGDLLDRHSLIVTPHICSPIEEGPNPTDYELLKTGIFNLGFLALRRAPHIPSFLAWWQQRMRRYAYRKDSEGLFYDQIWMNYIPAFCGDAHVLRDLGHNMANWNLHERTLSRAGGNFSVNGSTDLVFFHFSHYRFDQPDTIASYHERYSFETRPDLRPIFDLYRSTVLANGHEALKGKPCFYKKSERPRHADDSEARLFSAKGIARAIVKIPGVRQTVSRLARHL